jgi:hypothetical protein
MYGQLLGGAGPLGAPPAIKGYPQPIEPPTPAPTPTPAPGGAAGAMPPPPSEEAVAANEAAHRAAYEAHQEAFMKALAADYAAGKISREDLKKGASYTGVQPYHQWKQENVTHLKEIAKARE